MWHSDFFVALVNSLGPFVSLDDNSSNRDNFDFSRITLKVKLSFIIQQSVSGEYLWEALFLDFL